MQFTHDGPPRLGRWRLPLLQALWGTLLLSCVLCSPVTAASTVRDAHAKVAQRVAKDLESLWGTARSRKLYAEAESAAVLLLHFAPDHERVREWLGYTRCADETWKPAAEPEVRSNEGASEEVLASYRKRRTRKIATHVKSLWRILDKAGPEVDEEDRNFLLADLQSLAPDDPRLQGVRFDALRDGFWITRDVERMEERWGSLHADLVRLWGELPEPEPIELHPDLEWMDWIRWTYMYRVGEVGLWGVCSEKEGTSIAKACAVVGKLFPVLLGVEAVLPEGFGVVVFENTGPSDRLRNELGGTEVEQRARAGSGVFALPKTPLIVSARWQGGRVRLDSAVHLLTYQMFEETFGLGPQSAWAAQAVCLTMTKCCTRTRYTVMGGREKRRTELDARLEGELYKEDADWFETARKLANRGRLPGLGDIASQPLTHLYCLELLACAVHGAYMLTVHPEQAPAIFRRLGQGETTAQAFQEELGVSLEEWDRRVRKWVDDVSDYDPTSSMRKKATKDAPR